AGCQRATTGSNTAIGGGSPTVVATAIATTGCSKNAPTSLGVNASQTLTSSGLARTYLLHVPSGYQANTPTPLVLDFHGHTSTDTAEAAYTQFSPLADQQTFIVAYPQGTVGPDHETGWATYGSNDPTVNDVQFVSDLITTLQGQLC